MLKKFEKDNKQESVYLQPRCISHPKEVVAMNEQARVGGEIGGGNTRRSITSK